MQKDNRPMILLLGQNVYRWKQTILIVKRYGLILIPDPVYLAIHKIQIYKSMLSNAVRNLINKFFWSSHLANNIQFLMIPYLYHDSPLLF